MNKTHRSTSRRSIPSLVLAASTALSLVVSLSSAHAASVTWASPTVGGDYNTGANWTGGSVPNPATDTGQFNPTAPYVVTGDITLTGTSGKIGVGGTSGITFGSSVGANTITLFSGTSDAILAGTANQIVAVNDNVILGDGSAATTSITSNVANANLTVAGNITAGTGGTPGVSTLSFGSASTKAGDYFINGNIDKGASAFGVSLVKRGAGVLTLTGTNAVTLLAFGTTAASGDITGTIRINGGTTTLSALTNSATPIGDGANSFGTALNTNTVRISAGTLNTSAGRSIRSSIVVDGGTLNFAGGNGYVATLTNSTTGASVVNNAPRFSFGTAGTSSTPNFTLTSGSVNYGYTAGGFGVRFGNDNGANATTGTLDFYGVQTGGTFTTTGNLQLGGATAGPTTASYKLSGGIFDLTGTNGTNGGIVIGADNTAGTSTANFELSGTGKLIVRATPGANGIVGSQATAAFAPAQVFSMTGGTLVAGNIDSTNLRSTAGGTNGNLVIGGGSFAPGDVGSTGRTTITAPGGVNLSSGAKFTFDLAGTTASTAFQDAALTGRFDTVGITGGLTLAGNLEVNLRDSFTPLVTDTFTILTTSTGITGAFNNIASGSRINVASGVGSFQVDYAGSNNVVLSAYVVPEPSTWSAIVGGLGLLSVVGYRYRQRFAK